MRLVFCKELEQQELCSIIPLTPDCVVARGYGEIQQAIQAARPVEFDVVTSDYNKELASLAGLMHQHGIHTVVYALSENAALEAVGAGERFVVPTGGQASELVAGGEERARSLRTLTRLDLLRRMRNMGQVVVPSEYRWMLAEGYLEELRRAEEEAKKAKTKPKKEKKPKSKKEKKPKEKAKPKEKGPETTVKTGEVNVDTKKVIDKLTTAGKAKKLSKEEERIQRAREAEAAARAAQGGPPVPTAEVIDLTAATQKIKSRITTSVGNVKGLMESVFSKKNEGVKLSASAISLDNIATEAYEDLDEVPLEFSVDASMYTAKVYKSPIDYLIQNELLSDRMYRKLMVAKEQLKSEKGLDMTLEDIAVVTKMLPEEAVIKAMIAVYNVDFISSERLARMPVLTSVYPRTVCKKYVFFHTTENPRTLVAVYNNNLPSNLGSNFGNAQVLYSLPSCILDRIKLAEEVEGDNWKK